MNAPARLAGLVIVEPAEPAPHVMVTARLNGGRREWGRFFDDIGEARRFACELAENNSAMVVDLIAAAEGEVAE